MGVAVSSLDFKDTIAKLEDRNIEGTAAEVVNGDLFVFLLFVQPVGQGSSRRLVDNTLYFQTGNFTGVFGSLALTVVKIGRNGNNGFADRLAQESLGIGLQFA